MKSFAKRPAYAAALTVGAVTIGGLLGASAAMGQSAFTPPLAAPMPLSAPVAVELKPGARANCVNVATISSAGQTPPERRQLTSLSVDRAEGGLALRLSEKESGLELTFLIDDAGKVALQPNPKLGRIPAPLHEGLLTSLTAEIERTVHHKRSYRQGQTVIEGSALATMLGLLGGAKSTLEMTGGQRIAGETMANGRRALVATIKLDAKLLSDGAASPVELVGSGVNVIDVATGLQRYSEIKLQVTPPSTMTMAKMTIKVVNDCAISEG